ncbi:MAG: hypothetical protein IKY57_04790 [Alistipes sp.]|nr:hypothetical protein [Alistipes sp.]
MNRLLELLQNGDIIGRTNNGYWTFMVYEDALTEDEKLVFYNTPIPFEYGNTSQNRKGSILRSKKIKKQ